MNKLNIIRALSYRAWLGTFADKGRIVDMLLFPVSHLTIWGLFLYAGLVEQSIAEQLFFINMVWAIAMTIQTQASRVMMFDLWSREFPELFRSGIDANSYMLALLFFGMTSGIVTIGIFMLLSWGVFSFSLDNMMPLIYALPSYLIFSLALAIFAAAIVVRLNQTYGFIAFSMLTFIVMLSSPYSPVENLPVVLRDVALASPLGLIFEFIRNGDVALLYKSTYISIVVFVASYAYYFMVFKRLRQKGDFFNL